MSITKDFEKTILYRGYRAEDVLALLAHARALEEMLRKHQFDQGGYGDCPECQCDQYHSPGCALAKLIKE